MFLDLYDNFVRDMSGLEALLSLRVLMLGKNRSSEQGREGAREGGRHGGTFAFSRRICRISGLQSLVRLDVLDLHGNQASL